MDQTTGIVVVQADGLLMTIQIERIFAAVTIIYLTE